MPKFSVIVPVYNGEKTIERCLLSILRQSMPDIEVIIINDGSTDDTVKKIEALADSRVKLITTENSGQGFARNVGIENASGEYIAFIDADDTIDEKMLEAMYNAAKKSGSDAVQCNIYDIYSDGTKRIQLASENESVRITDKGLYCDTYFTTCRHSYEVCNKLIKKEVIGDLRFRDTRKYFSEDLLFNLELISRINSITFLSAPYYNYYQNEESHMHGSAEKRLEGIAALFRDYIDRADGAMKDAAAYTAAMTLAYSAGLCDECSAAENLLSGAEYKQYVKGALKRRCEPSHRAFLTAMLVSPKKSKKFLAEKYAGRWRR